MATDGPKQRNQFAQATKLDAGTAEEHPGGHIKHGSPVELLRLLAVIAYFILTCSAYVNISRVLMGGANYQ
jgi:hypothetical protein